MSSILDGVKNLVGEGVSLAGSAISATEKLAHDALNTDTAKAIEKPLASATATLSAAVSATWKQSGNIVSAVADLMPGVAVASELVRIGANTLKSSTTGDLFKIDTKTSILAGVPGLSSLLGGSSNAEASTLTSSGSKSAEAGKDSSKAHDELFSMVSTKEWQQIISDQRNAATTDAAAKALPDVKITGADTQYTRTAGALDTTAKTDAVPGEIKVEGKDHIHIDADGTKTTQTGDKTEIDHNGHKITKDTSAGTVTDTVDGRTAFSQNTTTNTKEWNTKEGARVVEENGQYKIYNKDGNLVLTRPVSQVQSEVQDQTETLANGELLRRHPIKNLINRIRTERVHSGKEWDVYQDGISKTLSNDQTVGMTNNSDAFITVGDTTVLRKAADKKYYLIEGNENHEIDLSKGLNALPESVRNAVAKLQVLDNGDKIYLGDGTFMTVKDGQAQAGVQEIVDEPANAATTTAPIVGALAAAAKPAKPAKPATVDVTMVTTDGNQSTAKLQGGLTEQYDFGKQQTTILETNAKPGAEPIVQIDNDKVTTADVITTHSGTTDRKTGDVMGTDGSITTSNGIHVSANNDIQFADGTRFGHDGSITLSDGRSVNTSSSSESAAMAQQAASALAAAQSSAEAVMARASNGTLTFADIAALQDSLFQVSSLASNCLSANNMELAQSLMSTGGSLEAALGNAQKSFADTTTLRALRNDANNSDSQEPTTKFSMEKLANFKIAA